MIFLTNCDEAVLQWVRHCLNTAIFGISRQEDNSLDVSTFTVRLTELSFHFDSGSNVKIILAFFLTTRTDVISSFAFVMENSL